MSFGHQVHAELVKARRRGPLLGALGVLLFFAILPLPLSLAGLRDAGVRTWAQDLVTWPGSLWNTLRIAHLFIPILVAVVAGVVTGSDYAADTWKMVLPRTPTRSAPLLARFVTALLLCVGGLLVAMLAMVLVGLLGATVLGLPYVSATPGPTGPEVARIAAFFLLELTLLTSLTVLTTVLTRSLLGGVLLGIALQHVLRLLTFVPLGWTLPLTNLDALQARWMEASHFRAADVQAALGRALSWPASTASVVGFSLAFLLGDLWLFGRRDQAS